MTQERNLDEALLVRRCADGDEAAWETFVDRYGPLLQALARRMLARRVGHASGPDVDEVVADVFLALLRKDRHLLRRYDPRWRLATYLGVVCRTAVSRRLTRRGRGRPWATLEEAGNVSADPPPDTPLSALTTEEQGEVRARLERAMAGLSGRDRLLLKLRYLDGLDYGALAIALDVRPASIGPLLTRARRRLAAAVPDLVHLLEE